MTALLKSGFNSGGGYWDGPGIDSSFAANPAVNGGYLTSLGVASGVTGGNGASTTEMMKYTYYGDADLSGTVDGTDYNQIDTHNGQSGVGWQNGDFNYDGVVDASDYTLIDNAFNLQGSGGLASPLGIVASKYNRRGRRRSECDPAVSQLLRNWSRRLVESPAADFDNNSGSGSKTVRRK